MAPDNFPVIPKHIPQNCMLQPQLYELHLGILSRYPAPSGTDLEPYVEVSEIFFNVSHVLITCHDASQT